MKPPSLCPPTSPNRWRLIQIEFELSCVEPSTDEGDQRIRDESVEEERMVGTESEPRLGLHERDVIPNSWPMSSASKVTENWQKLIIAEKFGPKFGPSAYLPSLDLTVNMCRLSEICLPPSPSPISPSEASNASNKSSLNCSCSLCPVEAFIFPRVSIFHKRMVAS